MNISWSELSSEEPDDPPDTSDMAPEPSMPPTNATPSMPVAASMTLSAVAYASSFSISSGMITDTLTVFDVIVGIMVMPVLRTPMNAATKSTAATPSGIAL